MTVEDSCPLCGSAETTPRGFFHGRSFQECPTCSLTFVSRFFLLSRAEEKARYEQHNNDPAAPGYRAFLLKLVHALEKYVAKGASGLDYGSGPVPALAMLLRDRGFVVSCYDPFFELQPHTLEKRYDFVTCCEVCEHFHHPAKEFELLAQILQPGGILALRTSFPPKNEDFASWHYMRDPTHVCFYSPETFSFIAKNFGFSVAIAQDNVIILKRSEQD